MVKTVKVTYDDMNLDSDYIYRYYKVEQLEFKTNSTNEYK